MLLPINQNVLFSFFSIKFYWTDCEGRTGDSSKVSRYYRVFDREIAEIRLLLVVATENILQRHMAEKIKKKFP